MTTVAQPSTATQAASLLLAVRRGAARLDALPAALAPQTLAEAYAIQHALLRELHSDIAGWKASLFSADDGICAPLPACAVLDAPTYPQALNPPVLGSGPFGTEAEIAFRLGHDLPPLAGGVRYDRATVCAAVVSAHAVIEVVSSRYVDDNAVPLFGRVADGFMNLLLVVGPSCPDWRQLNLRELPLEVRIDGMPVHQARGGHPLGDPLVPLVWLANHLSQLGRGLRGGEVITTGSCSGVQTVKADQTVSAFFTGLGTAVVRF